MRRNTNRNGMAFAAWHFAMTTRGSVVVIDIGDTTVKMLVYGKTKRIRQRPVRTLLRNDSSISYDRLNRTGDLMTVGFPGLVGATKKATAKRKK